MPRIASIAAAVQVGLGLGVIAPVEHVVFVHLAHAERDMDEWMEVAPAGFEQQHARGGVLAQPVGQHAPGGAGADDDVVVALPHAQPHSQIERAGRKDLVEPDAARAQSLLVNIARDGLEHRAARP